jgi:hypothetical protein
MIGGVDAGCAAQAGPAWGIAKAVSLGKTKVLVAVCVGTVALATAGGVVAHQIASRRMTMPIGRQVPVGEVGERIRSTPTVAQTKKYSVEDISAAMGAAEAQMTDVTVKFELKQPVAGAEKSGEFRLTKATYARKMPGGLAFFDRETNLLKAGDADGATVKNEMSAFNGKSTLRLDRTVGKKGNMRAVVFPGYSNVLMPSTSDIAEPCSLTWQWGTTPLAQMLRAKDSRFAVAEETEMMDGNGVVKVEGTALGGKLNVAIWVSPQHGFLPVKFRWGPSEPAQIFEERVLSDIVMLPNGTWFARKIVRGLPGQQPTDEYQIASISVDPIPDEFFHPTLPPNTVVHDRVLEMNYKVGADPTAIQGTEGAKLMAESDLKDYVRSALAEDGERAARSESTATGQSKSEAKLDSKAAPLARARVGWWVPWSVGIAVVLALLVGAVFRAKRPAAR